MQVRTWQGDEQWEEIRPLGKGGQSEVVLVRNRARISARKSDLNTLIEVSGQGYDEVKARRLAEAVLDFGRPESPSELGALKIYNPRAAGAAAEQQALARLRVEISVLKQNRRGLPRLLDSKESDRWIVTEYLPGGTLEDRILTFNGNPLSALTSFRSLVETVATLHRESIFHRDIKPANIFLGTTGGLILGDFGIAFLPNLPERLTFTNESVGPRDYMPPWIDTGEQIQKIDARFDVYELGKVLWCMIAGRLKLPREWFRRPDFDLTKMFPQDPRMHSINAILERCLNENREKCLPHAVDLLAVVDSHLSVMQGGGQLLNEGVPRPCRTCGKGFYQPSGGNSGKVVSVALVESMGSPGSWRLEGAFYARLFVCDSCGHLQMFKT